MFRIKICGITTMQDALAAVDAGTEAIGLNFCAASPRCISPATADRIVQLIPPRIAKVGVFVNETVERLIEIADALSLDFIQLHGDEPPTHIARLAPRCVIRAFRVSADFHPVIDYLQTCRELSHVPTATLIDAYVPGVRGGTGKLVNWDKMDNIRQALGIVPMVLAGGLNPENVAEAIRRARPAAVDVASGVEVAPGQKDAVRMRRFVEAARRAWENLAAV